MLSKIMKNSFPCFSRGKCRRSLAELDGGQTLLRLNGGMAKHCAKQRTRVRAPIASALKLQHFPRQKQEEGKRMTKLPNIAGIGLKPEFYTEALDHSGQNAEQDIWYEVHPENYMVDGGPRLAWLEADCR